MSADDLSTTAELVGDLLAARYRLGEHVWTVSKRAHRGIDALQKAGLVTVLSGVVEGTVRLSLTEAGRERFLHPEYRPPSDWWQRGWHVVEDPHLPANVVILVATPTAQPQEGAPR